MPEILGPPFAPFTTRDALASGISRRRLRTLIATGDVRRVLHGVYQATAAADTLENRAAAASHVLSPHGVICDRTAAWIHGVDTLRFRELEVLPPLDVVVLRHFSPTSRAQWRNGQRDLSNHDVMRVSGIRVTTPLRTALDLGCKSSRRDGLAAVDAFMRLHGISHEDMYDELPRFAGRRGVVQLRSLLLHADPRSESAAESWIRMYLIDAGLPTPELQHSVEWGGYELYRLDLAYPRHMLCIEYDGVEFHSTEQQRAADDERRAWLRAHGWTIIVVTREELSVEAVDRWTSQVRSVLHRRAPWPRG